MISIPFTQSRQLPAVSEPRFEIEHQSQGSAAGGIGALVATITGAAAADPWPSHVIDLGLKAQRAPRVDVLEITVLVSDSTPEVVIGDGLTLKLGVTDAMEPVFSGTVRALENSLQGSRRVIASSDGFVLARSYINSSFEQQSAGDIISSLLSEHGVAAGSIAAGNNYPFYVVDDSRSVYQHIHRLAMHSGLACYFDAQGQLVCEAITAGNNSHSVHYGVDIVALHHTQKSPLSEGITVIGSSALPGQGQDAASWLTKEPQVISRQSGANPLLVTDAAIKEIEAAESYSGQLSAQAGWVEWIDLEVHGVPAIRMGDAIAVEGSPNGQYDGEYLVYSLQQKFRHQTGFNSEVRAYKQGGAASGGLF